MENRIGVSLAGGCIVGAALLYELLYIVLSVTKIIERKDVETFAGHVEFHALRDGIKSHMLLTVQEQVRSPHVQKNSFTGLG